MGPTDLNFHYPDVPAIMDHIWDGQLTKPFLPKVLSLSGYFITAADMKLGHSDGVVA